LTAVVLRAHADSDGVNGAPRITADLRDAGHRVNRKTVASIMAGLRIQGVSPRPWKVTTVPDPAAGPLPDLVERNFDAGRLDAVWISDITYLATGQGWLYLAVVRDACSRRVLGWAIEEHQRASLITTALEMALDERGSQRPDKVVFHADRGSQYTSAEVVDLATAQGLACSAGASGVCWDNAMAESFWATLKVEYFYRHRWPTKAAATHGVTDWINRYNTRRRHSALGMLTPLQFEMRKRSEHTLAA
jgi:transposase InsO family protein